jgi:DNA-binding MarR family transcriptional regulator
MVNQERLLELSALFKNVIKKFRQEWAERMDTDISITQFRLLHMLKVQGMQRVVDIADYLSVTPGAVTGMADRLIERGLIARIRSEDDRRVVYLQITASGEEQLEAMQKIQNETVAAMFRYLPEKDVEELHRIFSHILRNLPEKE